MSWIESAGEEGFYYLGDILEALVVEEEEGLVVFWVDGGAESEGCHGEC